MEVLMVEMVVVVVKVVMVNTEMHKKTFKGLH